MLFLSIGLVRSKRFGQSCQIFQQERPVWPIKQQADIGLPSFWRGFWRPLVSFGITRAHLKPISVTCRCWQVDIAGRWPTVLAGFAFGIYLVHRAMMLVAFKLFGADVDRTAAALFSFVGSLALTRALLRLPVLQRFV